MAYRTFKNTQPFRAARFEGLPNLLNAINQNQLKKAEARQQELEQQKEIQRRIENIDRTPPEAGFPQDQDVINKDAKAYVGKVTKELMTNGSTSPKTLDMGQDIENMAVKSRQERKVYESLGEFIQTRQKNDPYFNSTLAEGYRRDEAIKDMGVRDFNKLDFNGDEFWLHDKYLADYVNDRNTSIEVSKYKDGEVTGKKEVSGSFIDANGNINVTEQDVKTFLSSGRKSDLLTHYHKMVDMDLDNDIRSMVASGNLPPSLKGLPYNDVKTAIINNPNLNLSNSKPFNERVFDYAKNDLVKQAKIDKMVNINYVNKGGTESSTRGGSGEERAKIATELRKETLDKIVYDNDSAALQAAFGGLKGVSDVQFYQDEPYNYVGTGQTPPIGGITLMVPDEEMPGQQKPVNIPLKTDADKREAMVILNKYIDEEGKGTSSYVGPERIIKAIDEDVMYSAGDKSYSVSKLRDMGYTDNQIQQAIELGNLVPQKKANK